MVRRRRPRPHRLVASLGGAAVLAVGGAYLAGNVVPGSDAGTTVVRVVIPTVLRPLDARLTGSGAPGRSRHGVTMSARLFGGQSPLAHVTVELLAGRRGCQALTDASGTASCAVTGLTAPPASWTATFAGSGPFQPSSVTAPLGIGGGGR